MYKGVTEQKQLQQPKALHSAIARVLSMRDTTQNEISPWSTSRGSAKEVHNNTQTSFCESDMLLRKSGLFSSSENIEQSAVFLPIQLPQPFQQNDTTTIYGSHAANRSPPSTSQTARRFLLPISSNALTVARTKIASTASRSIQETNIKPFNETEVGCTSRSPRYSATQKSLTQYFPKKAINSQIFSTRHHSSSSSSPRQLEKRPPPIHWNYILQVKPFAAANTPTGLTYNQQLRKSPEFILLSNLKKDVSTISPTPSCGNIESLAGFSKCFTSHWPSPKKHTLPQSPTQRQQQYIQKEEEIQEEKVIAVAAAASVTPAEVAYRPCTPRTIVVSFKRSFLQKNQDEESDKVQHLSSSTKAAVPAASQPELQLSPLLSPTNGTRSQSELLINYNTGQKGQDPPSLTQLEEDSVNLMSRTSSKKRLRYSMSGSQLKKVSSSSLLHQQRTLQDLAARGKSPYFSSLISRKNTAEKLCSSSSNANFTACSPLKNIQFLNIPHQYSLEPQPFTLTATTMTEHYYTSGTKGNCLTQVPPRRRK